MKSLKVFRATAFHYFVAQFARAEGSTDEVRNRVLNALEGSSGTKILVEQMIQMNSKERLTAISGLLDQFIDSDNGTRETDQAEWIAKASQLCELEDGDSSDTVVIRDPANSVYELSAFQIPHKGKSKHISTILKGCSLVSLHEILVPLEPQGPYHDAIKTYKFTARNIWYIKRPYRDADVFVTYQDALKVCRAYSHPPIAQTIIKWLENQLSDDPADRQRLRILEAVDSTKYAVTFLGATAGRGHLVLLRASDGHVHVASFMKACLGLPLHERDIWDNKCARLTDLLDGPVNFTLNVAQTDALTLRPSKPGPRPTILHIEGGPSH